MTVHVHVRYNSWYISFSSSVRQQYEMIKFCVVWRTYMYMYNNTMAKCVTFYFTFTTVSRIYFCDSFDKQSKWL